MLRLPVLATLGLLMLGLAAGAPTLAEAQQAALAAAGTTTEVEDDVELTQDIVIEGLGFSKLVLGLEVDGPVAVAGGFRPLAPVLERDLCWSGVFNLWSGQSRHCRIQSKPERMDMRLALTLDGRRAQVRLYDTGPEGLLLYEDSLPLDGAADEDWVMEMVNRLTERVTGAPGLLGSTIGYVLRQPGYAKVIVATSTHGRRLRLLSHNRDINILPRFRPGGLGLVYTVLGRKGSQVYYQSLEAAGAGATASYFLTTPGSLNTGGAFSPDGRQLVMTMSVNNNADLFIVDVERGEKKQLTSRLGIETQAHWAPAGDSLVFVSDRSGTPQIYQYDLETGEDLRLTFESSYNADPRWSPDGRSILFTRRVDGTDQIHIMDRHGENVRRITHGRYYNEQAEWSPDGRQIVFASNRTGEFKLYIVSTDGTGLRRVTRTPQGFEENSPTWTLRRLVR